MPHLLPSTGEADIGPKIQPRLPPRLVTLKEKGGGGRTQPWGWWLPQEWGEARNQPLQLPCATSTGAKAHPPTAGYLCSWGMQLRLPARSPMSPTQAPGPTGGTGLLVPGEHQESSRAAEACMSAQGSK